MRAWVVDAFADARHRGNPAAVIPVSGDFPDADRMQAIAAGLAVPTTAFVLSVTEAEHRIRWFTPKAELGICGHATIAAARYLHDVAGVDPVAGVTFRTASGPLYTRRSADRITVDLPRGDTVRCAPPPGLADLLGARVVRCERASDDLIVELESQRAVAALTPDFAGLARIDCRGHVVTARAAGADTDFVSRSFFPALGVNEDQVCVSAHCKLAPYWGSVLGKDRMTATQLSERGGRLEVEVAGDRVLVTGTARLRATTVTAPGPFPPTTSAVLGDAPEGDRDGSDGDRQRAPVADGTR
jgi:predicted PhzF superfamily epimerase YddE/YHI9